MTGERWTTEITPQVGKAIRLLQEKKGLRVKDLAREADVGTKTIQRIRNLKKKQAFSTSDLHRLAQALGTTLNELLGEYCLDWLSKEDDYASVNLMFECVKNMELTPIFRVYDSTWLRHQLVNSWDEVQNLIASGIQYEGVEGLISVNEVGQGMPIFQILEDLPNGMSNYFLATEDVAKPTTVPSTFFGWAFPNNDPLFWPSLARLEHLRLFTPGVQIQDNIYTTGHDFINKRGRLELKKRISVLGSKMLQFKKRLFKRFSSSILWRKKEAISAFSATPLQSLQKPTHDFVLARLKKVNFLLQHIAD